MDFYQASKLYLQETYQALGLDIRDILVERNDPPNQPADVSKMAARGGSAPPDVSYGSISDLRRPPWNVRFTLDSRH